MKMFTMMSPFPTVKAVRLRLLFEVCLLTGLLCSSAQARYYPPKLDLPPVPEVPMADQGVSRIAAQRQMCLNLIKSGEFEQAYAFLVSDLQELDPSSDAELEASKRFYYYARSWRRQEGRELSVALGQFLRSKLVGKLESSKGLEAGAARRERLELLMNVYAEVLSEPERAVKLAEHLQLDSSEDLRLKKLRRFYGSRLRAAEKMVGADDAELTRIGVNDDMRLSTAPQEDGQ